MTNRVLAPPASYLSLLHQPKPQSHQLGQWIPICLNYHRVVSSQQNSHSNNRSIGLAGDFKLFCWVLGQSDRPFSVKIGGDETVDDLKKEIKKQNENTFAGIDAYTLDLWKVGESSRCRFDDI